MKLLLDANLSWRLTEPLKAHFENCVYVDSIGLPQPASDLLIWNYAAANQCIIVTNDEDLLDYMRVKGFPPKVVLLRTGNQLRTAVLALLVKHKEAIAMLQDNDSIGLLEIY